MFEVGPQHPISYRQEIVKPLFDQIRATESCYVVGAASVGKSRLLQHIGRQEIQEYFLESDASNYLIITVDLNRARDKDEWGFYELMLTSIIDACIDHSVEGNYYQIFNEWRMVVLRSKDPVVALRQLETAARLLVQKAGLKLCFLFDEFDDFYATLPAQALTNLRALRDKNKYRLCYVMFLRNNPTYLRDPDTCEGFYELFSRSALGLKPYSVEDSIRMVEQIRQRRGYGVPRDIRDRVLQLSGGFPGLIMGLIDVAMEDSVLILDESRLVQLVIKPRIDEECRKLWNGLPESEQRGLVNIINANTVPVPIRQSLDLKGITHTQKGRVEVKSPLFESYVRTVG